MATSATPQLRPDRIRSPRAAPPFTHDGAATQPVSLDEPLLDVSHAARLLNVKVSWIREATRTGLLPCIKVGRHVRYTRPMLEEWLTRQRTAS